jgi:hypothetical protein
MVPTPKDLRFELRLGEAERDMLRTLADRAGESEAVVLRQLIRQAFALLEKPEPKKKR